MAITPRLVAEGLLITDVAGEWEVWCGADGENIINAHLIGRGATKAAAVADAIEETETLLKRLRAQAAPSLVPALMNLHDMTHESDDPRGPWYPIKDGKITKRYVVKQVTP